MVSAALLAAMATAAHIESVDCARFTKIADGVKAECGYLRVVEERGDSTSRQIGVPFAIVRNANRTSDDPVIFLTGGPGGRAIPRTIHAVDSSFGGRDLIFFEQRGTELADPKLDCPGYAEEKQRAQRGEINGPELANGLIRIAAKCAAAARDAGARLSGYTTQAIVADIEDFRALSGYRQIDLVGLSYSGKVVAEYARDHPDRTRAVIANTPLTVEANYDEYGESAMRRTLDLVIAGCERTPSCDDAHPRLDWKFRQIVARAAAKPWTVAVDDPDGPGKKRTVHATGWVVANALLDQLYSPESFETLPARIDAIWNGDLQALASIIDIGKSSYPWLMRMALWCNEEVPFEDEHKVAADLHAYPEFGGVDQSTIPLGLCKAAGFKAAPPARENQPVSSDVPFLIFSGEFDPATPPSLHRATVRTLPHATIALFPWAGHGAGFSRCGGRLLERFLNYPHAALDTSCTNDPPAPVFSRSLQ
jgi:pimeloyl-ACP methyl ester carboxylesterase